MKYTSKIQKARLRYLKGAPLSEKEQEVIKKDLSGKDYQYYSTKTDPMILPEQYSADTTFSLVEKYIKRGKSKQLLRYAVGIAATLLFALVSIHVYQHITQPEMEYIATSFGEKKTIVLPDGSEVVLNSMSALTYQKKMRNKTREVELTGEAFFKVKKDKSRPFTVRTSVADVNVLGTKFNVDAYENQSQVITTLFEGSVAVDFRDGNVMHLSPGEQAVWEKNSRMADKRKPDNIGNERAWQQNMLIFNNTPLLDILKTLEREHDVQFVSDDAVLNSLRMTARFSSLESVDAALTLLGESADFAFYREGKRYTITSK